MTPVLDLSKEYGLVLEGGGAKGAYQIGAWKALREAGIRIRGISGTSVGALNGALIAMDDPERAEYIWEHISYSSVMDVDDSVMENLRRGELKNINVAQILGEGMKWLRDGGIDIGPLKNLISETVDETRLRAQGKELYVTTFSVTDRRSLTLELKDIPEGSVGDMLLASAYFPVFKKEKLGGKRYMDGGGFDNVPFAPLVENGYKDLIVIRIYGLGFDSEKTARLPEDVTMHHIAPRQNLGGILEFDPKRARRNMKLGYYDGLRLVYGLRGRRYYLDAPNSETYYFDRLTAQAVLLKEELAVRAGFDPEELRGLRDYTERLFPALAERYRLRQDWDYGDLYLSIIEDLAGELRINRFAVYTPDQLLRLAA